MYARAVEEASSRLSELRQEELGNLSLAALSVGMAVALTQMRPELAMPFFLGGLVVGALGLRALWRRWDLVDRLSGQRDAYWIPEVLARAEREATMQSRQRFATRIRDELTQTRSVFRKRVQVAAQELAALAFELEDDELALDPACAVACMRLVTDLTESPLLNPALPPEELRSCVRQIRSGFAATR